MSRDLVESFPMSTRLASVLWVYLYDVGEEELAQLLSDLMVEEGVELDPSVEGFKPEHMLAFWAHHLIKEGVIKKVQTH